MFGDNNHDRFRIQKSSVAMASFKHKPIFFFNDLYFELPMPDEEFFKIETGRIS